MQGGNKTSGGGGFSGKSVFIDLMDTLCIDKKGDRKVDGTSFGEEKDNS